jgi:hypothetical protein
MIYVADGPSDIPCFSLVDHFHGKTFAVYKPNAEAEFKKAAAPGASFRTIELHRWLSNVLVDLQRSE